MEVASPLTFAPTGTKRSLACSPQLMDSNNHRPDDEEQRVTKRRRFDKAMDSLSEDFSSHGLLFSNSMPRNNSIFAQQGGQSASKRMRGSTSPVQKELQRVVDEQATLIESLKKDKSGLEESLTTLKKDQDRVVKENQILRKAITIQQERQKNAENEVKSVKADAAEQIKGLENVINQLRYHLQSQQNVGNDFMHQRPPDVY